MIFRASVGRLLLAGAAWSACASSSASRLVEMQTVDESHIMLRFQDAWVHHEEGPEAPGYLQGHESRSSDRIEKFGEPLVLEAAVRTGGYRLRSTNDAAYALSHAPLKVHRKTKVSGTAWGWPDPELTYEHTLFVELPRPMRQGSRYTLTLPKDAAMDAGPQEFTFDVFANLSEALHTSIIGHKPGGRKKAADIYLFRGDGGPRDYSAMAGRQAWLVNAETGVRRPAGRAAFWRKSGVDFERHNLTGSDVWTCDFDGFREPGRWRLAVEGIGCTQEFEIRPDAYLTALKTSVIGFFYMRIGEKLGPVPPPRQPRFIPGEDAVVYLTSFSPWHPDWKRGEGDLWDMKDWSKHKLPGDPTNPNAWGGHSDALDWDRRLEHISIVWDLLFAYLLTLGRGGEDDFGIPESGNGIPDVIDEAAYEADYWLRLRGPDGGYSCGLNNPSEDHKVIYQAATRPYMAWANAANSGMMALAHQVAGRSEHSRRYRAAAEEAWSIAKEEDLDESYSNGNGGTSGRDLKQIAAASLFALTGEGRYEEAVIDCSMVKTGSEPLQIGGTRNQVYGTALYLLTGKHRLQPIRFPAQARLMRRALEKEALEKHVIPSETRPSRRATDANSGWAPGIQQLPAAIAAHALTDDPSLKSRLMNALLLEADWAMGRNPLNASQMTGLGARRPDQIYTSGRNDGVPGVHPGHTPYMNTGRWNDGFMGDPGYYASRGYPEWPKWPVGEGLWRAPYCYANNEFTPQQAMGGKHCLLAYLHAVD